MNECTYLHACMDVSATSKLVHTWNERMHHAENNGNDKKERVTISDI